MSCRPTARFGRSKYALSFDASPFRERFEAKGRYRGYLQSIPTWVIQATVSPALAGASTALTRQSAG